MSRDEKIAQLLLQIKQEIEEVTGSPASEFLTEEEIIILATELVTSTPMTRIEYSSPIGIVDRTRVSFMLDEINELPIYWEGQDEDIPI